MASYATARMRTSVHSVNERWFAIDSSAVVRYKRRLFQVAQCVCSCGGAEKNEHVYSAHVLAQSWCCPCKFVLIYRDGTASSFFRNIRSSFLCIVWGLVIRLAFQELKTTVQSNRFYSAVSKTRTTLRRIIMSVASTTLRNCKELRVNLQLTGGLGDPDRATTEQVFS